MISGGEWMYLGASGLRRSGAACLVVDGAAGAEGDKVESGRCRHSCAEEGW